MSFLLKWHHSYEIMISFGEEWKQIKKEAEKTKKENNNKKKTTKETNKKNGPGLALSKC